MLGAKPIASFTEGTDRAQLASNLYPAQRKAFLRSHNWNAAIKRAALAPLADAPAFDFTAQFLLPSDCVRLIDVGRKYESPEYRVEGGKILCSGSVLYVRYLTDLDEGEWDDAMVNAMELRMAALFAYPITQSAALADSLKQQAELAFKQAKTLDGQEDDTQAIEDSPLLDARFPGGGV